MTTADSIALRVLRSRIRAYKAIAVDCSEAVRTKLQAYQELEGIIKQELAKAESSQVSRESSEEIRF